MKLKSGTPQMMQCVRCRHEWQIATLPIGPKVLAAAIEHACCPQCNTTAANLRLLPALQS